MILDPINYDDEPEGPQTFPCACGDHGCLGDGDDPQNVRIGRLWWAADCVNKPRAITEDQDRAFRADERAGK